MDTKSVLVGNVLEGKVLLITGGGSGIGLQITTDFGRHGAAVAIMGRRKEVLDEVVKSLAAQGIRAVGIPGDVRNKEDAARAVQTTVETFGRLDFLVNAAAGNFLSAAEDLSPNAFRTVMEIDTLGTYIMCHTALHYLKRGGKGKQDHEGGVIINISATAHYSASWYQLHMSAAKAAIDSITRSLALEWGTDYGIRVVGIAPGPIGDTPGLDKLAPNIDDIVVKTIPLQRFGEKTDISIMAIFLASEGGKYVTGTTIIVDGGNWIHSNRYFGTEAVRKVSREIERKRKALLVNSKL